MNANLTAMSSVSLAEKIEKLKEIISLPQLIVLTQGMKGEEGQYFADIIETMYDRQIKCPVTYETDGKGGEVIAQFRYFFANSWAVITELDIEGDQNLQAYGYISLGGYEPEPGYINIAELIDNNFEMDFNFEPKTLNELNLWKRK